MAEAWRSAPLAGETPAGAVTGRAQPKRGETGPTFTEAWRSAPLLTGDQKMRAISQGAMSGFAESGGVVGGAILGGKIGAVGGPVSMAAGAALGAGAGLIAGQQAKRGLSNIEFMGGPVAASPESMPQELRPFGFAGEVVGAGAPFAGLPVQAAGAGFRFAESKVGTFLNHIIETAGSMPRPFLASEVGGIFGAAVAGGAAESVSPGNTGARIASEVIGGMFNPARIISSASGAAYNTVRQFAGSFTPAGKEARAAKAIQDIVVQFGEDPVRLAKELRAEQARLVASGIQAKLTPAQLTGSPALVALETKLARESAQFGADSKKMAEGGLSAIQEMILALRGTGDPQALRRAAEIQQSYFRTVIAGRLQIAEREATQAAQRISADTPQARSFLAQQANELVENAMREARTVERELWERVPKDVRATADSLVAKHAQFRNEMLPEEQMPQIVEQFIARMKEQGVTTSGELLRFRSRALDLAREAGAQGRMNDARIFGGLAESTLDDLSRLSAPTMGSDLAGVPGAMQPLEDARAFSREFHDVFTRTFAGDAMATRATGADRIPPEILLRRAIGSGKELGELRLRELEEAMRFLPQRNLGGPEAIQALNTMMEAQERVLRLAAREALDPLTGEVGSTRLARFMESHSGILDKFPEVRTTLQRAVRAEINKEEVQRLAVGIPKIVERQAAFAKVLKTDSASDAVKKVLAGDAPQSEIIAMARLAKGKGGGAEAVEGFKSAVWDDAVRKSIDVNGDISFEKLHSALFKELRPGLPPLANILQKEKILSAREIAAAQEFIKRAQTIESAMARGGNLDQILANPDAAMDLVIRVAGAKLGSTMHSVGPGGGGAGTIIAAGRGSAFAQQVMNKVPQAKIQQVLISAMTDPNLAALLLEKPTSPAQGIRLARQIHAYLLQAGITGDDSE